MSAPASHHDLVTQPVREVMSHPVLAVTTATTLDIVLGTMVRSGLRHVAVVDRRGVCQGVVSDRAVTAIWAAAPSALAHMTVGEVLDVRPALIPPEAVVGDVARRLYHDRIDAAAVIDRGGRPIGMVTVSDLIGVLARHQSELDRSEESEVDDDAVPAASV